MLQPVDQIRFYQSCSRAMFGYASAMTAASGIVGGQVISFWSDAMAAGYTGGRDEQQAPRPRGRQLRLVRGARMSPVEPVRAHPGDAGDASSAMAEAMGKWAAMPWLAVDAMANEGQRGAGLGGRAFPFGLAGAGAMPWSMMPWANLAANMAPGTGASCSASSGAPMPFGMDPALAMRAWLNMDYSRLPASWPMAYGMMVAGVPKTVACPMAEANLAMLEAYQLASGGVTSSLPGFQAPAGVALPDFFGGTSGGARHSQPPGSVAPFMNPFFKV